MRSVDNYTGMLRRMRFAYWLFNLLKLPRLFKNRRLYAQLGIRRAVWQTVAHADIKRSSADIPWMDAEGITPAAIRQHPHFATFAPHIQAQLCLWPERGYLIIPGLLATEAEAVNAQIEALKQDGKIGFNFSGKKIFNAWRHSPATKAVFHHPLVLDLVKFIFQKEVIPFQTVNFIKGSGEKTHSDSIHMTTEPLGYLVAAWVALQDIEVGSGELLYYPGSHKLGYVMSEDFDSGHTPLQLGSEARTRYEDKIREIIERHDFAARSFVAKKGDVLIWHANLLHAGSPIAAAQLTRKSMVSHYFGEGVLQYHEITQRPAIIEPAGRA